MHEIGLWATTLATLVGFALALGFNPALYGATADMLARGTNAMPRLCAMVAGLWLGATVLYIVFQFFNPTSFVSMLRDDVDKALFNRTVDLVAGIILIVSGAIIGLWAIRVKSRLTLAQDEGDVDITAPGSAHVATSIGNPSPSADTSSAISHGSIRDESTDVTISLGTVQPVSEATAAEGDTQKSGTLVSYFGIGLGSSIIGFTTLPIMFLTGRVTAALSPHLFPRVVAFAVFLIALGAPFFLLALIWYRFPRISGKVTASYKKVLHWEYRWLVAALLLVFGLFLLAFSMIPHR